MSDKPITLTEGNKCGQCGYNHLPPNDGIGQFIWNTERAAGYHSTACSNVSPIRNMGLSRKQALKVFKILNESFFK